MRSRLFPGGHAASTLLLIVEFGTLTIRLDAAWSVSGSGSVNAAIATAEATGIFTPPNEQIVSGEEATRPPVMPPTSRAASVVTSATTDRNWQSR
jgi:hypothetical protein